MKLINGEMFLSLPEMNINELVTYVAYDDNFYPSNLLHIRESYRVTATRIFGFACNGLPIEESINSHLSSSPDLQASEKRISSAISFSVSSIRMELKFLTFLKRLF